MLRAQDVLPTLCSKKIRVGPREAPESTAREVSVVSLSPEIYVLKKACAGPLGARKLLSELSFPLFSFVFPMFFPMFPSSFGSRADFQHERM